MKNWVEGQTLDLVVMTVFKQSLTCGRPNDDAIVSAACGKLLTVFLICNAIDCVSVTSDLLYHLACVGIIYKNAVSHCNQDLGSIYVKLMQVDIPGLKQAAQTVFVIFDSAGGAGYSEVNNISIYNEILPSG